MLPHPQSQVSGSRALSEELKLVSRSQSMLSRVGSEEEPFPANAEEFLGSLELMEYYDQFCENGFDRIQGILDIQESDLDAMPSIRLGHRRMIQRKVATLRGVSPSQPLNSWGRSSRDLHTTSFPAPAERQNNVSITSQNASNIPSNVSLSSHSHRIKQLNVTSYFDPANQRPDFQASRDDKRLPSSSTHPNQHPHHPNHHHHYQYQHYDLAPSTSSTGIDEGYGSMALGKSQTRSEGPTTPQQQQQSSTVRTKRKYRRRPKPDANSPEKPPSAYVMFSNSVREEEALKGTNFSEMAKVVGERWKKLHPGAKQALEDQVAPLKQAYQARMAEYKKTPAHQAYQKYLRDFEHHHAQQGHEVAIRRRKRAGPQSGGQSTRSQSSPASRHDADDGRKGNISSSRVSRDESPARSDVSFPSTSQEDLPSVQDNMPSLRTELSDDGEEGGDIQMTCRDPSDVELSHHRRAESETLRHYNSDSCLATTTTSRARLGTHYRTVRIEPGRGEVYKSLKDLALGNPYPSHPPFPTRNILSGPLDRPR